MENPFKVGASATTMIRGDDTEPSQKQNLTLWHDTPVGLDALSNLFAQTSKANEEQSADIQNETKNPEISKQNTNDNVQNDFDSDKNSNSANKISAHNFEPTTKAKLIINATVQKGEKSEKDEELAPILARE